MDEESIVRLIIFPISIFVFDDKKNSQSLSFECTQGKPLLLCNNLQSTLKK